MKQLLESFTTPLSHCDRIAEHEGKYLFKNPYATSLLHWLQAQCHPDPEFAAGIVSSIYFDTRDLHFLGEKENSDFIKRKVRIRWYSNYETESVLPQAFLEIKTKIGSRREKVRLKTELTGDQFATLPFCHTSVQKALAPLAELGLNLPIHLVPVIQINYRRRRFIEPVKQTRICIDFDINTTRANPAVLPIHSPKVLDTAVLEIKGPSLAIPFALTGLFKTGCRAAAFSKYFSCIFPDHS